MRNARRNKVKPGISPDLAEAVRQEIQRCQSDLSRFNETILCRSPYWSRQDEICESVLKYPVTAVKAGNAVGKSRVASGIVLGFALTHPGCRVVLAAPTLGQLSGVLWAEIESAYKSAERNGRFLGGRFDGLTLDFGDGWLIEGWGQGSVESKSGRHAGDLLALVDEASGVGPGIFAAINSLNPSRRVYLGNPLRPEGVFFETCERPADHINVITIPSLESPHIDHVRSLWGMADRTWLEENRSDYGEDSLWWLCHVLAKFPNELSSTLLPAAWLNAAALLIHVRSGPVRLGVDIALGREGDDSCIAARDDTGVLGAWFSNKWSLEQLADQVEAKVKEFKVHGGHVVFDASGVGADFLNRLKAKGILGSKDYMGARGGGEKFSNLRAAAGWLLRRRLDPHRTIKQSDTAGLYVPQRPFALPRHLLERFRPELQGVRYALDDRGRIRLENKEDFVKRLKRSPNFLDALCMTFAYPHS